MTSKPTLPCGYNKPQHFPMYTLEESKQAEQAVALEKLPRELVPKPNSSVIPPLLHLCYIVEEQDYPSLRKYAQQYGLETMSVMKMYRLRESKDVACGDLNEEMESKVHEMVDGGSDGTESEAEETEDEVDKAYELVTLKTFDAFRTLQKIFEAPHIKTRFCDLRPKVALVVNPNQNSNIDVAASVLTNYALLQPKRYSTQGPDVFEEWLNSEVLQRSRDRYQRPCWRLSREQCRWAVGVVRKSGGAKS